jgi:hypothetical protein
VNWKPVWDLSGGANESHRTMGWLPLPACQFLLMTLLLAGGVTGTAYPTAGQGVPEPENACHEHTVLVLGYAPA